MPKKARQIAQLIYTAHPQEAQEFVRSKSIFGSKHLTLIASVIDGYVHDMSSAELTAMTWDEPKPRPLDAQLTHLQDAAFGRDFYFGLGRAIILRELFEYTRLASNRSA
jgi:hypothetical protein